VQLAVISGISQSNISKIEAGKYNASLNQMERLLISLKSKVIMEVDDL
jgi:predicted transcriptional regulator